MALRTSIILRNFTRYRALIVLKDSIRCYSVDENPKVTRGVVLGVYKKENENDEPKLTPTAEKFDDRIQGKLVELIKECNITGKLGKGKVFHNLDHEFRAVAIVGVGKCGAGYDELEILQEGMENVRVAAGVGAHKLQKQGVSEIYVESFEFAEQAAEGSALATYLYQDNKRKQDKFPCPKLELYESPDTEGWTRGLFKAEAQNLARRLSDTPANQMTPTGFAQATMDCLCPCGITVEVRTIDWIEQNNLNSFLIVARGSCEPPVMLEIQYCGAAIEDKPILLVGSGLTFNSGGICLKKKKGMDEMRADMAGAGVVVATIRAAAALSLPINVYGIVPLCENMPSGMACKPGDVVTCLNGKNLCIHDTAKAAQVIMADPLLYGQNVHKPRLVVDVATLSSGVKKAFGGGATGIFSSSNFIWKQFQKAGALTGDRVWRMPLWNYYKKKVTDYLSFDLSNKGHGPASACLGAAILHEFVPCADWAHLDIRGVGMLTKSNSVPYLMKDRMTGRPTRTLIQFIYQMACPEEQAKELKK